MTVDRSTEVFLGAILGVAVGVLASYRPPSPLPSASSVIVTPVCSCPPMPALSVSDELVDDFPQKSREEILATKKR